MLRSKSSYLSLISGIIISLIVSIVTYIYPQTSNTNESLIIGLLGVLISIGIYTSESILSIKNDIINGFNGLEVTENIKALGKIDPFFLERYNDLIDEVNHLKNGEYHLYSIYEVYKDDIRSMKLLVKNDRLFSMCSMATISHEAIINQINTQYYKATINQHIECANKGIKIIRLYIFKSLYLCKNNNIIIHLKQLESIGIDTRIIIREHVETGDDIDFIIFGDKKVSIGKIDIDNGLCNGAIVLTKKDTIKKYTNKYNSMIELSISIDDLDDFNV